LVSVDQKPLRSVRANLARVSNLLDNPWKLVLGFIVLLLFLSMGIAHVIYPDYFLQRSPFVREHS
jgi:hypothetical protein